MIKTSTFGIREFVETINRYGNNDNDIGLFKIIGKAENEVLFNRLLPARLDAVSIFFVERGETIIEIDFKKYHLQSNNLLDIGILHVIQSVELFDNSVVYHLIIGKKFIDLALREKKPLPLSYIFSRRENPLFTFGTESCGVLCSCMENFASHLANRDHIYRSELLQNDIQVLLMEIGNIAHHQEKVKLHVPKVMYLTVEKPAKIQLKSIPPQRVITPSLCSQKRDDKTCWTWRPIIRSYYYILGRV